MFSACFLAPWNSLIISIITIANTLVHCLPLIYYLQAPSSLHSVWVILSLDW
jgi:Na+-driven multidrug efflux pump